MSDPQAIAAARAAAQTTHPGANGGPGPTRQPLDVNTIRAKLQSGELTLDQVMSMVQRGEIPPNIIEQLGGAKREPPKDQQRPPMPNVQNGRIDPQQQAARPQATSSPPPQPARQDSVSPGKGKGTSQPITRARNIMRTRVRKLLIRVFGTFCTINSVVTTTICFAKLEETWRGVPGSWSWVGVAIGLVVGVWLWLWQLSLSDWDSLGIFVGYCVVLVPDVYMTMVPWYGGILLPILSNSMQSDAAVPVAFGISLLWALISSKASDWAFLGRPALTLLERIAGRT